MGHFCKPEGRNREGSRNPNWKGGRRVDALGYVRVWTSTKVDVFEHIICAEKALGKPLPMGAEVHHHNGTRDSGPLVVCQDKAYHNFLHRRMRAYKACGHANWRKCWICKEYDDPINLTGLSTRALYHEECHRKYKKEKYEKEKRWNVNPMVTAKKAQPHL